MQWVTQFTKCSQKYLALTEAQCLGARYLANGTIQSRFGLRFQARGARCTPSSLGRITGTAAVGLDVPEATGGMDGALAVERRQEPVRA